MSHIHISEVLQKEKDTCLMSDETRKHGDIYEVFAVSDSSNKEWVLGLRDMCSKSSETCLDSLKSVLKDIDDSTTTTAGKEI